MKWYRLAAERGNWFAHRHLGILYAGGRGVPRNELINTFEAAVTKDYRRFAPTG